MDMLKLILDLDGRQLGHLEAQPRDPSSTERLAGSLATNGARYTLPTNIASGDWISERLAMFLRSQGPFLQKGNAPKEGVYVSPFSFHKLVTASLESREDLA